MSGQSHPPVHANEVTTFTVHTDPCHGWMEVPLTTIMGLRIENDISSFSYIKGEYNEAVVYLEEDCDMPLFIKAFKQAHPGVEVAYNEVHTDDEHWIRDLFDYRVD